MASIDRDARDGSPLIHRPDSPSHTAFAIPHILTRIINYLAYPTLAHVALVNKTWFCYAATELHRTTCIPSTPECGTNSVTNLPEIGSISTAAYPHEKDAIVMPWPLNVLLDQEAQHKKTKRAEQHTLPGVEWARQEALDRIQSISIFAQNTRQCVPLGDLAKVIRRRSSKLPRVELQLGRKDDPASCALLCALKPLTVHIHRSSTHKERTHSRESIYTSEIDKYKDTGTAQADMHRHGFGLIHKVFLEPDDTATIEQAGQYWFARQVVLVLPRQYRYNISPKPCGARKVDTLIQALEVGTWDRLVLVSDRFSGWLAEDSNDRLNSASRPVSASPNALERAILDLQGERPAARPKPKLVPMSVEAYRSSALYERDEERTLEKAYTA